MYGSLRMSARVANARKHWDELHAKSVVFCKSSGGVP